MTATVSLMHHAHQSFGRKWKNMPHHPTECQIKAFTDTCAQTCTSGPKILEQLQCPASFLIPTSHGIHGITKNPLEIMGTLLLLSKAGVRQTCQVVYVAKKHQWPLSISNSVERFTSHPALFPQGHYQQS